MPSNLCDLAICWLAERYSKTFERVQALPMDTKSNVGQAFFIRIHMTVFLILFPLILLL